MTIALLVIFLIAVILFYSRHNHDIKSPELSKEDLFIKELFDNFSWSVNGYDFIRKPITSEEWKLCKKICDKYGYDYKVLFRDFKKPFFNYALYYPTYVENYMRGTLNLIKL